MRRAVSLTVVFALVGLAVYVQHARDVRPTVQKVADAAWRGPQTRTLPVNLPDLSSRGWRTAGGRADEIGGRTVVSAEYHRGGRVLTISRMADTKGLNDGMP